MSIFNALLILGIISLVALKVYSLIIRQEHFYRDFSVDEDALSTSPPRVAMFIILSGWARKACGLPGNTANQ